MTVGELKALLADVPDWKDVFLIDFEDRDETFAYQSRYPVGRLDEVDAKLAIIPRDWE